MKSFNKFLGLTSVVLLILLIGSIFVISMYLVSNPKIADDFSIDFPHNLSVNWGSFGGKRSSSFKTVVIEESKSFSVCDEIVIDTAFEDIIFVEEERDNILVEYYHEKPDTPLYKVSYSIDYTDDKLTITSNSTIRSLMTDKSYDRYVKIYVPNDYTFETLDLSSSLGEINNDSILSNVDNLIVNADLGDVNFEIESPKKSVTLNCDMGRLEFTSFASIESFDASCSLGDINIELMDPVGALWCTVDMGSLDISAEDTIDKATLNASMGNIDGKFKGHVGSMTAEADMGNITMSLHDNEESTAYADADLGDVDCDLPIVKKNTNPDFELYASLGNINVKLR